MFVSREKELHVLNTLYSSKQFEFIVIYGRRRVGKTALITEFIKNKSAIYFVGVESNSKTGFTKTYIDKATVMQNVSLVTYNDIINNAIKQSRKK